jgi:hypothetical protein
VEDHIGFQGYSTIDPMAGPVPINPDKTEGLFDITTARRLNAHVNPFSLADVSLFSISAGGNLFISNPFTGEQVVNVQGTGNVDDLAMRPDGVLYTVLDNSGSLRIVDSANGGKSGGGDDGIPTFGGLTQDFGGMAFRKTPGAGAGSYQLFVANNNNWDRDGANDNNEAGPALWRLDPSTGALFDESSADRIQNVGALPSGRTITGLAFAGVSSNIVFAVDSVGSLWRNTIGGFDWLVDGNVQRERPRTGIHRPDSGSTEC